MRTYTKIPKEAGRIVSMIVFKDRIIIAAEYRMYELIDEKLYPLKFQQLPESNDLS